MLLQVHDHLKGLRTMFLSFHHFKEEDATQILRNSVDAQMPILVAENWKPATKTDQVRRVLQWICCWSRLLLLLIVDFVG